MTTVAESTTMTVRASSDGELVQAALRQQPCAYGELFRRWFDRSYDIAFTILRDRGTAADVAQETFLAARGRLCELRDAHAFGAWILRGTRQRALRRVSPDRFRAMEPIEAHQEDAGMQDLYTDTTRHAENDVPHRLIWSTVAILGEHDTSLLDLHLRHGLTHPELAEELHGTPDDASQLLFRLRRALREAVGAVLLWHDGQPTCSALAPLIPRSAPLDSQVAATIRSHQRACEQCQREVSQQSNPERLFATVPFAIAPLMLKERAATALAQAGIPMASADAAFTQAATGSAQRSGTPRTTAPSVVADAPRGRIAPVGRACPTGEVLSTPGMLASGRPAWPTPARASGPREGAGRAVALIAGAVAVLALVVAAAVALWPTGRSLYSSATGQLPVTGKASLPPGSVPGDRQPPAASAPQATTSAATSRDRPPAHSTSRPSQDTTLAPTSTAQGRPAATTSLPGPSYSSAPTLVGKPTPTPTPSTATSSGVASPFCTYSYQVGTDDNGNPVGNITITNVSSKTWDGWVATFSLSPAAGVVNGWGGTFKVSGPSVTFTPASAFSRIVSQGWVMFGFQAPSTPRLSGLAVQGHACQRT